MSSGEDSRLSERAIAAQVLIRLLEPLLEDKHNVEFKSASGNGKSRDQKAIGNVLTAVQGLVATLSPERPLFAAFHDGQVHYPLGGGAYAFQKDLVGPMLSSLLRDEDLTASQKNTVYRTTRLSASTGSAGIKASTAIPTRPVVVHAGAQPNNSPHAGTLFVFCYAFLLARGLRDRIESLAPGHAALADVAVEVTFIDTAPVNGEGLDIDGLQYQRSYRDVPGALKRYMPDYNQILGYMSQWSGIPYRISFQDDFFRHPSMPSLLAYAVENRTRLASQLSPKHNALALRSACPIDGCALAEKHGRLISYPLGCINFVCPRHGEHGVSLSNHEEVARLEANAPTRNLLRSMSHLLDESTHHIRITGADYAGTYQEAFLYRPLAEWSASTGLALNRTPHILYAPLVVDWSGAKLSKGLYVRQGGYDAMDILGTGGLRSYQSLQSKYGPEGLRRIWDEVERWLADPHKLFRASISVEYLQGVLTGKMWQ